MAVDIHRFLEIIAGDKGGEQVSTAIINAAITLRNEAYPDANIDGYLETIRKGTYGADIREAIHQALYILSTTSGSSGPILQVGDPIIVNRQSMAFNESWVGNATYEE